MVDAGYPDLPGAHLRGEKSWALGIGHPRIRYQDGTQGGPTVHHADHPIHDVEYNTAVFTRIAEDYYKLAQKLGVAVDHDTYMKAARAVIKEAVNLRTNDEAYKFSADYLQARDAWATQNPGVYPFDPGKIDTTLWQDNPVNFDDVEMGVGP